MLALCEGTICITATEISEKYWLPFGPLSRLTGKSSAQIHMVRCDRKSCFGVVFAQTIVHCGIAWILLGVTLHLELEYVYLLYQKRVILFSALRISWWDQEIQMGDCQGSLEVT